MDHQLDDAQMEIAEAIMEGRSQTVEDVIPYVAGQKLIASDWERTVTWFLEEAEEDEKTWDGEAKCPFEPEERPVASFDEWCDTNLRVLSLWDDGSVLEEWGRDWCWVWPSVGDFLKAEYGDVPHWQILRDDPDSAAGQLTAFCEEGW